MEQNAVLFELGEARTIPRHTHDCLELFYLVKGTVSFELDGEAFLMQERDVIACNAEQVRGPRLPCNFPASSNASVKVAFNSRIC